MNQMMIRVKHDGKCRKISEVPKTIEDLKAKIQQLFGSQPAKSEINYKDCDGELVSVIDTEDLKNCIAEAEAYKMTCITLLLKNGSGASRSMSSKKNSTSSESKKSSESSEEDHGFETVGDLQAVKVKAEEEAEQIKKKLIEEHQRALAQLEQETQYRIKELESKKDRKGRSRSNPKKGPHGPQDGMPLPMRVRTWVKFCQGERIENPLLAVLEIFKNVKVDFPALACNPEFVSQVLKDCESNLVATIKSSCSKVLAANPDLAKKSQVNKPKFEAIKTEIQQCNAAAGKGPKRAEGAERDQRKAEKEAEREERRRLKDAERLLKDAHKAEKQAKKFEEKNAKDAQRGDIDEKEKQIRAKVRALKEQFPDAHKPQLRAIVTQNLTLSPQELAPMIKASKIAKSNLK